MSDNTTETKPAGKAPSHVVYHVRDRGEGQKSFWTRIGSAWAHADGKGWRLNGNGLHPYYAPAVKSMSVSWKAFFYGALDPKATITIDKLGMSATKKEDNASPHAPVAAGLSHDLADIILGRCGDLRVSNLLRDLSGGANFRCHSGRSR